MSSKSTQIFLVRFMGYFFLFNANGVIFTPGTGYAIRSRIAAVLTS